MNRVIEKKVFKSLAQFKRVLKDSAFIEAQRFINGNWVTLESAKIGIIQTNAFTRKVEREGKTIDSWMHYPKSDEYEIKDNILTIYWTVQNKKQPIMRYWINQTF